MKSSRQLREEIEFLAGGLDLGAEQQARDDADFDRYLSEWSEIESAYEASMADLRARFAHLENTGAVDRCIARLQAEDGDDRGHTA